MFLFSHVKDMDFVVERRSVDILSIGTPANSRHRTSNLENGHRFLPTFISTFPYPYSPVIGAGGNELDPGATSKCAVEGVDDFAVGA